MKTGIKVIDAMTKSPIFIDPDSTIKKCAEKMLKEDVGGIIVKKDNKLYVIVTEKDMVEKAIVKNLNTNKSKVKEIMVKKMITIEPNEDIYDAMVKMQEEDVRRLPVIHKKELIGLLTEKDILKIEPQLFDLLVEKIRIREPSKLRAIKKYVEGECENCGNYAQLFNINDQLVCEECKDKV